MQYRHHENVAAVQYLIHKCYSYIRLDFNVGHLVRVDVWYIELYIELYIEACVAAR